MKDLAELLDPDATSVGSPDPAQTPFVAHLGDTLGYLVDDIARLDRMASSIAAYKAEAVDRARKWSEFGENQLALMREGASTGVNGWSPQVVAWRSLVAEMACALRIPQRTAENLVAESESLMQQLPATIDALRDGRISYRHARVMVDHVSPLPEEDREVLEAALVPVAEQLTVAKFEKKARTASQRLHPELMTTRHSEAAEKRDVTIQPGRDGMAWLTAHLPAVAAGGIYDRLVAVARSLKAPDEERTQTQLRTDVFADLLIDGTIAETGAKDGGIRPTVMVTVPVLTLLGRSDEPATLEGYGPIDPETARELAGKAKSFIRILTHPETGTVLYVGRDRYSVPQDMRNWLRVRDETCRFPGCNRKAVFSDIDHTEPWHPSGRTEYDNLAHLCAPDHHMKHHTRWAVEQPGTDGRLVWTSPAGKTYTTEPAVRIRPAPRFEARKPDHAPPSSGRPAGMAWEDVTSGIDIGEPPPF